MAINQETLKRVMKRQLEQFNNEGVTITNNTVHNEVLADDDGPIPTMSSKRLYKSFVRWTLNATNSPDPQWPANWMNMSVNELAADLIP